MTHVTEKAPPTMRADAAAADDGKPSPDPLAELQATVAQARKAAADVLGTMLDSARAALRRAVLMLVLAVICTVLLLAALVVGLILLLTGAAGGLAHALGLPTWGGTLLVGVITCPLLLLSVYLVYRRVERARLERAKERYADSIRN